ncbi:MAG: hypothetical protein JO280_09355 [Mycobacteriaceae bacterium]|nr:hypothetical protein [Mycobacteriaceae bacterium]
MSLTLRCIALWLVSAGAAAALVVAPIAAADPALPEPGSEDAAATISDLQGRGYQVQINYDNGLPDTDLSQCWVNNINTADATGTLKPVYVDVECPK